VKRDGWLAISAYDDVELVLVLVLITVSRKKYPDDDDDDDGRKSLEPHTSATSATTTTTNNIVTADNAADAPEKHAFVEEIIVVGCLSVVIYQCSM